MKRIKCESCGGKLNIDETKNKDYVTCSYCGTQYKLDKDLNEIIYNDIKGVIKTRVEFTRKIIKGTFIFILATTIISMIGAFFITSNFSDTRKSIIEDKYEMKEKELQEEINKFNREFEYYGGTKSKFMTTELLDDVSTNNRKNDRKISIKYETKTVNTTDEINKIKHSLKDEEYEIIIDYNKEGYVNKITVEKIED